MLCCEDDNCPVEDLRQELMSLIRDIKDILVTIVHSDDLYEREAVSLNTVCLLQRFSERLGTSVDCKAS